MKELAQAVFPSKSVQKLQDDTRNADVLFYGLFGPLHFMSSGKALHLIVFQRMKRCKTFNHKTELEDTSFFCVKFDILETLPIKKKQNGNSTDANWIARASGRLELR